MKPFWNGFLLSLSLCLDLGIVNLAVLRISLQQGGTAGFLLGVGSCLGDLVYFSLAVFGATLLLNWVLIRWVLWIAGTGALLWLAGRMVRDVFRPRDLALRQTTMLTRQSQRKLVLSGMGLALASPTAIVWFAAVGGSVIASFGGLRDSLPRFAGGFASAGLLWAAAFAYAAAALRLLGSRLIQVLSFVSAVVFLYFAGVVFINGLRSLL